jgi:MarR-like DNA-binding transcriptional regulator SgrR of sgrS sRNA
VRRITLHTKNKTIAKLITTEFTEKGVKVTIVDDVSKLPKSADLVVSTAATNSKDEWTAARLNCHVAILPEALGYLRTLFDRHGQLILVGADRGK